VTQPGRKPQKAAGEAGPATSATSYPAGSSPRVRLTLAGLTWRFAEDGAVVDVCVDVPG
jgi:hypothetical protein